MRPIPVLILLTLPAIVGCLAETPSEIRALPYADAARAAPGRTATFALLLTNTADFRADAAVAFEGVPNGWNVTAERASVALAGGGRATLLVNATPDLATRYGQHRFTVVVGDGRADLVVHVADGDATGARPGVGARVFTVGFFDNGTIFYTNWREIRDNAALPREALGDADAEGSYDALKVYVGGRRGERPPEPYNRSGYFPVIQGFDHALRGMRAGETTVARIAPEMAYTLPQNEDHPLYGEALTFAIHVVAVDVLAPDAPATVGPVPCPVPVCARAPYKV